MAYIESHQELDRHPKTGRAARYLGISRVTMIGHLHVLWHWALDYAADGDISRYEAEEIAEAAMWEGDPHEFLRALIEAGFVDHDGNEMVLHDWGDYAGRLIELRRKDADRKREARARSAAQAHDNKTDIPTPSDGHPPDIQRMSETAPADVRRNRNLTYPTQSNQNHPPQPAPARVAHGSVPPGDVGGGVEKPSETRPHSPLPHHQNQSKRPICAIADLPPEYQPIAAQRLAQLNKSPPALNNREWGLLRWTCEQLARKPQFSLAEMAQRWRFMQGQPGADSISGIEHLWDKFEGATYASREQRAAEQAARANAEAYRGQQLADQLAAEIAAGTFVTHPAFYRASG
jgi:hypothetical protein